MHEIGVSQRLCSIYGNAKICNGVLQNRASCWKSKGSSKKNFLAWLCEVFNLPPLDPLGLWPSYHGAMGRPHRSKQMPLHGLGEAGLPQPKSIAIQKPSLARHGFKSITKLKMNGYSLMQTYSYKQQLFIATQKLHSWFAHRNLR